MYSSVAPGMALRFAAVPLIGRHLPSLYAFVVTVLAPIIVRLALEGGIRTMLAIISALILLVLAEVFRTGTRLDEDQSLTV